MGLFRHRDGMLNTNLGAYGILATVLLRLTGILTRVALAGVVILFLKLERLLVDTRAVMHCTCS